MILDGVLNLLAVILSPAIDLLPTGTFPIPTNTGQGFKQTIWELDYAFPFLAPLLWVTGVAATTFLALLAYRVAIFAYSKLRGA